jgi:formylmethanofuran dehydrogenase subunit E
MKKHSTSCDGCGRVVWARFRTMVNRYLCDVCYEAWQDTGIVPERNAT